MSQIRPRDPEGRFSIPVDMDNAGVYTDFPKVVMGVQCAQHRSIKMIEVLNHHDIPCTAKATKRGLLQGMVVLQSTLSNPQIDVIKDWLLHGEGSFKEAAQARKQNNRAAPVDEDWEVYDPLAFERWEDYNPRAFVGVEFQAINPAAQRRPADAEWEVYDPIVIVDDADNGDIIILGERQIEKRLAVEERKSDCKICLESFPTDTFLQENITPSCHLHPEDHIGRVCIECLQSHIDVQLADPQNKPITCPICLSKMENATIQDFSTREAFERYTFKEFKASIERMEGYMKCLAPNCESGQIHQNGSDQPIMICAECNFQSCYRHKLPWHQGQTCEQYDHAAPGAGRLEEEQATNETLEKISKVCPNPACGIHIEKDRGCNHMSCTGCEHEFCWLCFADFPNGVHKGICKPRRSNMLYQRAVLPSARRRRRVTGRGRHG